MQERRWIVTGLECAACAERAERALNALDGTEAVRASFFDGTVSVRFDEMRLTEDAVLRALRRAGIAPAEHRGRATPQRVALWQKLFIALFLSLPQLWNLMPQLRIAVAVLLMADAGLFALTRLEGINRAVAALGWVFWAAGLALTVLGKPGAAACLAASGALIFLTLLHAYLTLERQYRAAAPARKLLQHLPKKAVRADGAEVWADELLPGDEIVLCAGERAAADGEWVSGVGELDESILTGDAVLRAKTPGDPVFAGTLCRRGEGILRVTASGAETALRQRAEAMLHEH